MIYQELSFIHPKIRISGHPDGVLVIEGKHIGFELKNKSQKVVNELVEPINNHVLYQTSCYAALLKLIRGIELEEYVIFYLSRGLPWSYRVGYSRKKGAPIKVVDNRGSREDFLLKIFRFRVDTEAVEKEFKLIKSVVKAQKESGSKLLSRKEWGICKDPSEAGFCQYRYICFNTL
jgi:CRISPR/Cas system-associated exonuclease Cas4 (RecB family)